MRRIQVLARSKQAGFSLVEMSIYLAIVGLVLGGVWAAASTLSETRRVNQTVRSVMDTVQNVRDRYLSAPGIPVAACDTDISAALSPELYPSEMRRCSGGVCRLQAAAAKPSTAATVVVKSPPVATGLCSAALVATGMRVVVSNLDADVCARLAFSGMPYNDSLQGISRLCAGAACDTGAGVWRDVTCTTGQCVTVPALTLAQAQLWCGAANRTVGWEFKLRI